PRLVGGRGRRVAPGLIVAGGRERIAFRPAAYWDLEAIFTPVRDEARDVSSFPGRLAAVDGRRVAPGRDFSPAGELRNPRLLYLQGAQDAERPRDLAGAPANGGGPASANGEARGHRKARTPAAVDPRAPPPWPERRPGAPSGAKTGGGKPYRRSPYAPFRTTTLQQEASRKLGFSAKYTMSTAQRLYENGHITYMRTDSVTLSQT